MGKKRLKLMTEIQLKEWQAGNKCGISRKVDTHSRKVDTQTVIQ